MNKGQPIAQRCRECVRKLRAAKRTKARPVSTNSPPCLNEIRWGSEVGLGGKNAKYVRFIWSVCELCGKERWVKFIKNKPASKYCQPCGAKLGGKAIKGKRRGAQTGNWNGGRSQRPDGYIQVIVYPENPFYGIANSRGYTLEHRLVMAKHLGRCLERWEVVHHKNGIKNDNRIRNLELTTHAAHIIAHNKGYKDGYAKGLQDGKDKQTQEQSEEYLLCNRCGNKIIFKKEMLRR